jgi:hypothetical protein
MVKYNVLKCENGKMGPVETVPGKGARGERRMMEGVNLTMIYYKNFSEGHNVPPV